MDDNPENAVEMPFVPLKDVQVSTPAQTVGVIIFFVIVAVGLYYLFKKRKESHVAPHIEIGHSKPAENYTFLDDKEFDLSGIHSTHSLPKGIRVTLQSVDSEMQYDATVIDINPDNFVVFINNDIEHNYEPVKGEKATFFAEIGDMRWSFSTEFSHFHDQGVKGYTFLHTYDIIITKKRKEARIFKELPSLFSIIPRDAVLGPIPVDDLIGKAQGEIPSTIHDISNSGCALHTRSPLKFAEGDMAVISFLLPDNPQEYTIFASVNRISGRSGDEGGGSIMNLEFIKLDSQTDEIIQDLVKSHIEDEIIT